jgi:hypothetical protein
MSLILEYYEPGKRPNTTRQAKRKVETVREAEEWLNQNRERAFMPASVVTNSWKRNAVAVFFAPPGPPRPAA